jgi:hypothetical protein
MQLAIGSNFFIKVADEILVEIRPDTQSDEVLGILPVMLPTCTLCPSAAEILGGNFLTHLGEGELGIRKAEVQAPVDFWRRV